MMNTHKCAANDAHERRPEKAAGKIVLLVWLGCAAFSGALCAALGQFLGEDTVYEKMRYDNRK